MFTGIVTDIGEVAAVAPRADDLRRIRIACGYARESIAIGASIACAGICLTVVATAQEGGRTIFDVDAAAETLKVTNAGAWQAGTRVNLERALKAGDELGGHIVGGHVDGLAEVVRRDDMNGMLRLLLEAPHDLSRFIAGKGSVALDGVSLTVNEVAENRFSVLVVPHTLAVTTLGMAGPGDRLHLEVDMLARYVARIQETR